MSDIAPGAPWPLDADGNPVPKEVLDEETRDEFAERGDPIDPADNFALDDRVEAEATACHRDDFDSGYYDPHAS
ncbi:hypothetical protein [Streptosporangium sp. G12]